MLPPVAQPPAAPGVPVQTIPGSSVVKALTGQDDEMFTSAQADDVTFSYLATRSHADFITHTSGHAKFTDAAVTNQLYLYLNVAVGPGVLTFSGAGKISASANNNVETALAGGQYSMPAAVPLNTAKLHEWTVQGTDAYVRVNAGGVRASPSGNVVLQHENWFGFIDRGYNLTCRK